MSLNLVSKRLQFQQILYPKYYAPLHLNCNCVNVYIFLNKWSPTYIKAKLLRRKLSLRMYGVKSAGLFNHFAKYFLMATIVNAEKNPHGPWCACAVEAQCVTAEKLSFY